MLDVDIEKLEACCADMEKTLRGGLLAMDLWDRESGLSLAGFNPQPAATALFNQVTGDLEETLTGSGFPGLNRYYLLDLDGNNMVVVLKESAEFLGGILLDSSKTNLGILVGVAIPKVLKAMTDSRNA